MLDTERTAMFPHLDPRFIWIGQALRDRTLLPLEKPDQGTLWTVATSARDFDGRSLALLVGSETELRGNLCNGVDR
jgi:hypothetical protein